MTHVPAPFAAAMAALALTACGPGDNGSGADVPGDGPAPFAAVNVDAPSRADLIAVCTFDQHTFSEADCACAADHALETYSPNLLRALVMDTSADPTEAELERLGALTGDEVRQLADHGLVVLNRCAGFR